MAGHREDEVVAGALSRHTTQQFLHCTDNLRIADAVEVVLEIGGFIGSWRQDGRRKRIVLCPNCHRVLGHADLTLGKQLFFVVVEHIVAADHKRAAGHILHASIVGFVTQLLSHPLLSLCQRHALRHHKHQSDALAAG